MYKFPIKPILNDEDALASLLMDCYIQTPSQVMVRRDVLDKIGKFNEDIITGDHDMWLRFGEVSMIMDVKEYLVGYRKHSSALSVTKARQMWEDAFIVLEHAQERYPYSTELIRKRWAVLNYRIGQCDWREGKHISALRKYALAVRYDPRRAWTELVRRIKKNGSLQY